MPFPYTRRRSPNRSRPPRLQPFNASPAQITVALHGTNKTTFTFDQQMDTNLVTVPNGMLVDGVTPTAITWTSATVAEFTTPTSTAADPYVMPANNVLRTASGAPVAAKTGALT